MTQVEIKGYIIALAVSLLAIPATSWWSNYLHARLEEQNVAKVVTDRTPLRIKWIACYIGIAERIIFAVLVGWSVSGAAGFIGSWVLAKQLGGWNTWSKGTTYGIALFFLGLLGNAMSVLLGVIAGLIIFKARGFASS
jgi:hypothetical protein